MKPKVERGRRVVLWLGVACLGLLPTALSCSGPKTPGAEEANERGFSHAEKGDHDKAIADFTEAIRLDPKDATAYNNRGASYAEKGDHDKGDHEKAGDGTDDDGGKSGGSSSSQGGSREDSGHPGPSNSSSSSPSSSHGTSCGSGNKH